MKYKHIITIAFIAIIAILIYKFFTSSEKPAYQDIKVVDTEKASLNSISQNINLIGTIKASNSSILLAQENGIFEIIMNSSSSVKTGELIARIINEDIQNHYDLSLAAETIALTQFNRANKLFKSNTYSKAQYENSKKELIAARKELSNAKIALAKLEFRSPFDGIIGAYKMQTGSHLQIGTPIVTIYNPAKIKIEFDIPVSAISKVKDGQKLKILDQEYQLTHVQKILDEENHMSPAYCDINCTNCIIGSNLDVDLFLDYKEQAIVIPFEAIFSNEGQLSIYVVKDDKTEVRNITLGIRAKDLVEVTEGLSSGEEFVSKNPARLYPGALVKRKE